MEPIGLIVKLYELKQAGPANGEICKSDHFIHEDQSFGIVLLVVVDKEVLVLHLLPPVLGLVNQQDYVHY